MKIAVFGSASSATENNMEIAGALGVAIAQNSCILVTGGCYGLPHSAAVAAKKAGAKTIAYSPGKDLDEHKDKYGFPQEGHTEFIFIPEDISEKYDKPVCLKYRNVISSAECDAGIIICGRIGTLNEFTNLYDYGKVIGVLEGTGGTADLIKKIIKGLNKESKAVIIYNSEPEKLVKEVVREIRKRKGDENRNKGA